MSHTNAREFDLAVTAHARMSGARVRSNPFATRFTRPGALPFFFPPETRMDVSQLTDRLVAGAYQGQICGAHGSGKSTLLMELQQELARRGIPVSRVDRPESQRAMLTRRLWQARRARRVVVVDGFERLRDGERAVVTGMACWWQSGLLVTCHRHCALPLLWETEVSLPVATAVVRHLTQDDAAAWAVASQQLEARLAAQRGDLRETLFELYDVCQGLAI